MQSQTNSKFARIAIILTALCSLLLSACAHHEQYTMWYDKEPRRQKPTTEPRVAQSGEHKGQCVQDWEVTYVKKGQVRERTKGLGTNYTGAAILGTGSLFSWFMMANTYGDAAGFWALTFLGTAAGAIGWGAHTLFMDLTESSPRETEEEIVETETRTSDGCDAEPKVASTRAPDSSECLAPALARRKLQQLEELKDEDLIDDAEYETERQTIARNRCTDATASTDPRERLRKLKRLKDEGLISEAEYDRKRDEILDTL